MRTRDTNRRRRLVDYRPLDATREERALQYQIKMHEQWEETGRRLGKMVGRHPQTLAMFSDDIARRTAEERFLIDQVHHALAEKDSGIWGPMPRIGDLYAQRAPLRLKNFETIRNPDEQKGLISERPMNFFQSKYYKFVCPKNSVI
jgi:hypothetical protein